MSFGWFRVVAAITAGASNLPRKIPVSRTVWLVLYLLIVITTSWNVRLLSLP